MFNLFGLTCIRPGCGHKNPKGAEFCGNCGISLAFNRPAILEGNEWQPAPDELAAFFKFKDLKKGFFTKPLYVPGGMKAWVLQDDEKQPVLLLNEGPHTVQTLFQWMNNFFRSPQGSVLVAKTGSVPLSFAFDDVLSLERLALKATVTLRVRVRVGEDKKRPDLAAFRRHFMQQPGVVTAEQLTRPDLLGKSVRDALRSFVGARGIDEMAAAADLNAQLDAHLQKQMGPLLLDLGLELVEPSDFTLHHEKLDEHNRLQGELWLLRREKGLQQAHTAALNDLYDTQERERLRARRLEIERKREAGELDKEDADLAHALRLREVEQYERIQGCATKEQAIRMGAADEVERLEHDYAARRRARQRAVQQEVQQRETEDEAFAQIKALARIRVGAEQEIERLRASSQLALERERAVRELEALQRQSLLDRAAQDQDEAIRAEAKAQQAQIEQERRGMQLELESRRHRIELADMDLAFKIRERAAAREQDWLDQLELRKISDLIEEGKKKIEDARFDRLERFRLMAEQHDLSERRARLEDERIKFEREQAASKEAFDQEMRREEERRKSDAERAEHRRKELAQLGALPEAALASVTESGVNVQAVVEIARVNAYREMSADQILAAQSSGRSPVPAAGSDAFLRAFVDQLGQAAKDLPQQMSANNDQATSNLIRAHESQQAALLQAMQVIKEVALGHPPAAPHAAPTPASAEPSTRAGARGGAAFSQRIDGRCAKCRKPVGQYQHWCCKCGEEQPETHYAGPLPAAGPQMLRCPKCREHSPNDSNYCWSCRHEFVN